MTINSLPNEILIKLWGYCAYNGDNFAFARVCKHFKMIDLECMAQNIQKIGHVVKAHSHWLNSYLCKEALVDKITCRWDILRLDTAIRKTIRTIPHRGLVLVEEFKHWKEEEDRALIALWPPLADRIGADFPEQLEGLRKLETARQIREWMRGNCEFLEQIGSLDFSLCGLSRLPIELALLKNLRTLWLEKNVLTAIPTGIYQLPKLMFVFLENNPIDQFPTKIGNLHYLSRGVFATQEAVLIAPELFEI